MLEKYLDDAYASANAAGSPVPDRSDPAWAPVYKSLERMMQGCMYRHVFPGGDHMFTSVRRMMVVSGPILFWASPGSACL